MANIFNRDTGTKFQKITKMLRNEKEDENLNFKEIIKRYGEFCSATKNLVGFDDKEKAEFFKEKRDTLEKFLEIIIHTDLSDIYVHYSLLGAFYELLMKVCILKENWEYIKDYKEDENMNFEHTKSKFIELLKNKNLSEKQIEKIKDVLNFVRIQSNNICATLFKEVDYNIIKFQIYESIAVLDKIFEINLNDDLLYEMLDDVFIYKHEIGNRKMDFDEEFEDKIKEIYLNLKPREKTPSEIIEEKLIYNPHIKIELDDGEFYPKEIEPVKIRYIPPAEPHALITDLYLNPEEWYSMDTLIEHFAKDAFLSYKKGNYLGSISCAINCCEYTLKYELLRRCPKEKAKELSENPKFSFGFFTGDNNKNLKELEIDTKFSEKLNYLNSIRIVLYHFNPRKIENIQKEGKTFMEKIGNPIEDVEVIRTAYKVYNIMKELVEYFYNNDETIKKEVEKALKDYNEKRNLIVQKVHRQFGLPEELIRSYLEKKSKSIEKEYLKSKKGS